MHNMLNYQQLIQKIQAFDPIAYAQNRNYTQAQVSELSVYISRGVIDTLTVLQVLLQKGYSYSDLRPFVQQLAWRDFFQHVWMHKGSTINTDLKQAQQGVLHHQIPTAVLEANTSITAIDKAIEQLQNQGHVHNHLRMYIAFLTCNLAGSHWLQPAQWMYYHLNDGDWASNALSWQWVAGAFASKKYIANQENINRFTNTNQLGTYLDCSYESLANLPVPDQLQSVSDLQYNTKLPETIFPELNTALPVLLYNYYNLSPLWHANEEVNRVLLLEPNHFNQYPISNKCLQTALQLAAQIPNLKIITANFSILQEKYPSVKFVFKEHPLNKHYQGKTEPRQFLVNELPKPFHSFFPFWKHCDQQLSKQFH